MKPEATGPPPPPPARAFFVTTRWSLVLEAARSDSASAREALSELCTIYWYPLYAYLRRRSFSPEDAQDLVQGFFERVLRSNWLEAASPERGKFRSWLLASLHHHLADQQSRSRALKRGAGCPLIALDALEAERRFAIEPRDNATPEQLFDRRWALAVLDQVLDRVRAEYEAEGKAKEFATLQQALPGGSGELSYRQIADLLGTSEGAVKVAIYRLRERYRKTLREEIGRTVWSPTDIDNELRHLLAALDKC